MRMRNGKNNLPGTCGNPRRFLKRSMRIPETISNPKKIVKSKKSGRISCSRGSPLKKPAKRKRAKTISGYRTFLTMVVIWYILPAFTLSILLLTCNFLCCLPIHLHAIVTFAATCIHSSIRGSLIIAFIALIGYTKGHIACSLLSYVRLEISLSTVSGGAAGDGY